MAQRVKELAERLNLSNVEIVTNTSQLSGKQKRAKGFFNVKTGKITIVIPNNASIADVEQTLLHEAVAHYGLRQLFGTEFNTFLDNVFNNASEEVRRKIVALAAKNGWDFRKATEEYLASLADKHNNTLIVELSSDGSYWNINTAGIFKRSYARNNKEVYNRHTTTKQFVETAEASQDVEQGDTQTPSSMNAPTPFFGNKDTSHLQTCKKISKKLIKNPMRVSKKTILRKQRKSVVIRLNRLLPVLLMRLRKRLLLLTDKYRR